MSAVPVIVEAAPPTDPAVVAWAERVAALLSEVVRPEWGVRMVVTDRYPEHGSQIAVMQERSISPAGTRGAFWRACRLAGPTPWNGTSCCWPCYRDATISECTHDWRTAEQPPPLPR